MFLGFNFWRQNILKSWTLSFLQIKGIGAARNFIAYKILHKLITKVRYLPCGHTGHADILMVIPNLSIKCFLWAKKSIDSYRNITVCKNCYRRIIQNNINLISIHIKTANNLRICSLSEYYDVMLFCFEVWHMKKIHITSCG